MKKFIKYWLPVAMWMGVIFTFSSFPTNPTNKIYWVDFLVKKTAHLIEYGFLSILVYRALVNSKIKSKKAIIGAILFSFLYGASDEFHQSFTPGRGPTVRDVLIDTAGASLVMYFFYKYLDKFPKLQKIAVKYELIKK